MSDQLGSPSPTSTAWDEGAARAWIHGGTAVDELDFPWHLAAGVVAVERPDASRVLDAGSGPGGFLRVALDTLPNATGVWLDFSKTMRDEAQRALADLNGRVHYQLGDLLELDRTGEPSSFDLITTSRVTHHLQVPDLQRFYRLAANLLRPGGFIANLDNLRMEEPWATRLREVRKAMRGPVESTTPRVSNHPHPFPAPLLGDHLDAVRAAGFIEERVVWTSFSWNSFATGRSLLMARRPLS